MLVIDAGTLFELVARRTRAEAIRKRVAQDTDHAAPHIIDVDVLGVIRRDFLSGNFDRTAAELALGELRDWPGQRFGHCVLGPSLAAAQSRQELGRDVRGPGRSSGCSPDHHG